MNNTEDISCKLHAVQVDAHLYIPNCITILMLMPIFFF